MNASNDLPPKSNWENLPANLTFIRSMLNYSFTYLRTTMNLEKIKEQLSYNPITGLITDTKGNAKGSLHSNGYLYIQVLNKRYLAHRLAWLLHYGELPATSLDHKDGDKSNNKIDNLRLATTAENNQNLVKARVTSTTGFLGVQPKRGKFDAMITVNRKRKWLGTFNTPEEAHECYLKAKRELHPFSTL